jgi:hypothetical protein
MAATFFLRIKVLSRAKGARATYAAAYRAGERIRDQRTSKVYDHSDRGEVAYKEIVLPAEWDDCAEVSWARDRESLWNTAEFAGKRCDARVAREVLVFLPPELTPGQRVELVRRFSRELAERYRGAVDAVIHTPRSDADQRHHHAHLLMTTREITPQGLGRRTTLEIAGRDRRLRGLDDSWKDEHLWVRKGWAQATNEAYREAGLTMRVDPRSFKDQGIDREPTPRMPPKVYYAERKTGKPTPAGDQIRAAYRERVEARLKGGDELARVLQKQKEEKCQRLMEYAQRMALTPKKKAWGALTRAERNELRTRKRHANLEEFNRRRREGYQRNRAAVLEQGRAWRKANADRINARERELHRVAAAEKKRLRALEGRVLEQRAQPEKAPVGSPRDSAAAGLEYRKRQPRDVSAEDSAANWKAFRALQPQRESAADSAANWKAFRARQPPQESAADSAANWKAFRARQPPQGSAADSAARWKALRALQPQRESAEDSVAKWKAIRGRLGPEETPQDSISKWKELRERERHGQDARGDSNERSRGQGSAGRADDDDDEDLRRKRNRSRDYDLEL